MASATSSIRSTEHVAFNRLLWVGPLTIIAAVVANIVVWQIAVAVVAPDQLRAPLTLIASLVVAVVSVFGAAAAVTPSIVRQVIAALQPDGPGMPLAILAPIVTGSAVLGAVVVYALVGRFARQPLRLFRRIALATLAVSLVPYSVTLLAGFSASAGLVYVLVVCVMHVVTWAIVVGMLTRLAGAEA